jgi:AraC-like DNA-binding protein
MNKIFDKRQRTKIAYEIKELKIKNPELTNKELAIKYGISDSYVSRLLKKYFGKTRFAEDDLEDNISHDLIEAIGDEIGTVEIEEDEANIGLDCETISGFVFVEEMESFFDAIDIKVKIPLGLYGHKRALAIHSEIIKKLKFEEI